MNKKQLEIYRSNILTLSDAVQVVGGRVGYALDPDNPIGDFLETIARNGIEIKVMIHPNIGE